MDTSVQSYHLQQSACKSWDQKLGSDSSRVLLQMRMQGLLRTAIHYLLHRWLVIGLQAFQIQVQVPLQIS